MKYLWLTIRHKWFVIQAGLKTGAPLWRLVIHDWTKFMPRELPHYQRQFFGKSDDPEGFIACWVHHQNHNPHHWEYWIPRTGHNRCEPPYPDNEPIPMPWWAVREMVADWMGAGRAYCGEWDNVCDWTWLIENAHKMTLHRLTKMRLRTVLWHLCYLEKGRDVSPGMKQLMDSTWKWDEGTQTFGKEPTS